MVKVKALGKTVEDNVANSVDPDEMPHLQRLIWVYTVCSHNYFTLFFILFRGNLHEISFLIFTEEYKNKIKMLSATVVISSYRVTAP